jgi:hypothetical protein
MAARQGRGGHGTSSAAHVTAGSSTASRTPGLLHTLETLQDSVWAESLLPMLVVQGSAGNVALSCKQLR